MDKIYFHKYASLEVQEAGRTGAKCISYMNPVNNEIINQQSGVATSERQPLNVTYQLVPWN